jgi:hypothetical protein
MSHPHKNQNELQEKKKNIEKATVDDQIFFQLLSFPSINNLYVSNLTIFLNGAA